jgi:hypothetical protein
MVDAPHRGMEMDVFRHARLLVGMAQTVVDASVEIPTVFSDSYQAGLVRKTSK